MLGRACWGAPVVKTIMEQDSNVGEWPAEEAASGRRQVPLHRDPPRWLQRQSRRLMVTDGVAAGIATLMSQVWVFGWAGWGAANLEIRSVEIPYTATVLVTVPVWLLVLATYRCHDVGPFGGVKNEFRRVVGAGAHFLAVIAVGYYAIRPEHLGREFLVAIVPLAVGLTLLGRTYARYHLRYLRDQGQATRRAIVMGSRRSVRATLEHLAQYPKAGIDVVAALTTDDGTGAPLGGTDIPVMGSPNDLLDALPTTDADLLLITGGLVPGELRKLTWTLEGTGVEVLVAPAAAHLTGPQFDVRPVAGLPVLYVDRTSLTTTTNLQPGE